MNQARSDETTDKSPLKAEAIQEFLHARSSRQENREIVRDLLRGIGLESVVAAAQKCGVAAALSGFDDRPERIDPDPDRYSDAFSRLLGPAAERESRPATVLEWQGAAKREAPVRPNAG